MKKHPGVFSFVVTIFVVLAYLAVSMGLNRNVDASAFIMAFAFLLFPFVWLLVFIIVSTINWFRDATGRSQEDAEPEGPTKDSGAPKKPHRLRGS